MAIDVSNLTILPERQPEIISRFLYRDTVLNLFTPHTGYNPGNVILRLYEGNGNLDNCCTMPENPGTFSEVETPVVCLMTGNEFCELDLTTALNDFTFRFTAGGESIDGRLIELFTQTELAKTSITIDRIVWQGDTTSSDTNLQKLDGLIKKAKANVPAAQNITITSGNLYTAIQQVLLALPFETYDMGDVDIFVGRDIAQFIQIGLVSQNLYNYNPGTRGIYDPIQLPGFAGVNIIPTRGLDGTNTIIATPRSNVHWLTNLQSDQTTIDWDYTKYHQRYYWRLKFLLGITFGIYDYVVVATISDAVREAGFAIPVSIVSPLAANGGVLTGDTAPAAPQGSPVLKTTTKTK